MIEVNAIKTEVATIARDVRLTHEFDERSVGVCDIKVRQIDGLPYTWCIVHYMPYVLCRCREGKQCGNGKVRRDTN